VKRVVVMNGTNIAHQPACSNDAMRRLVKIISIILMVFVILSVCVYRMRLNSSLLSPQHVSSAPGTKGDLKIAQGAIIAVDASNNVLLLSDGSHRFAFTLSDKTIFRSNDHMVQPTAISSGAKATVRYTQRGNSNLAQEILITSSE
jgi:hypothetical protein